MPWELALSEHTINSAAREEQEHCHTCSLLTPKELILALWAAVAPHKIAYEAGVIHRDISDGNSWFGDRAKGEKYPDIDKSLKDSLKRDWLIGHPPGRQSISTIYLGGGDATTDTAANPDSGAEFSFIRNSPEDAAVPITYALIAFAFNAVIRHPGWQTFQDAPGALPFKVPSKTYNVVAARTETRELRRSSQPGRYTSSGVSGPSTRSRTKKRRREEEVLGGFYNRFAFRKVQRRKMSIGQQKIQDSTCEHYTPHERS
ncbi:hypothetical protein B0H13DRAFT_2268817 [Mycena leptocephala]|nr:hypothetical protein B0H13DRAFT_2268817 [Mycena leptocephala]